jgi:murein L,D-transpeptidase YcbB/YkuD
MHKIHRFAALPLLLAAAASPALAQLTQGERPTQEQVATGEAPATPIPEGETAMRSLQNPALAPAWTKQAARDLLAAVEGAGAEGLDPAYYGPEKLRAAIAGSDMDALKLVATDVFLRLSADLALGRTPREARAEWHMIDPDLDANGQFNMMRKAIADNSVRASLVALRPTHPQYAELMGVLGRTTSAADKNKIRANLERWRWMPRDLGDRYVIVNVPAFTVALVENGSVVARHRAVVGAPKTATPQLSAMATGVILNPWWEIPRSIEPEVRGKKGYVTVPNGEGVRYRQPPGPSNALGRVKFVMPNNHAIYLHDTPSKAMFAREARAFSHGCIRTQDPLTFARLVLNNPKWDKAAIDQAVASGKTVQAHATTPTPVYIAYFTAAASAGTNELVSYRDVYNRDAPVLAVLTGKPLTALASK